MFRNKLLPGILTAIVLCATLGLAGPASVEAGTHSLGIYVYENIEGFHTVSSTANTKLAASLQPVFAKIAENNKVPLESNETVRILDELTEDRKVTVTPLTSWITGNVISAPTITFADDDIKFMDLTWHVDENAVKEDTKAKGLSHALVGAFSGMVKSAGGEGSAKKRLLSVTVIANMKLINVKDDSIAWSWSHTAVAAGFDSRVAFNDAVSNICDIASEELIKKLSD
jgi:hypothetical protein